MTNEKLERIGILWGDRYPFAADLIAEVRRLKHIVDEISAGPCSAACDSIAHDDDCPVAYPVAALVADLARCRERCEALTQEHKTAAELLRLADEVAEGAIDAMLHSECSHADGYIDPDPEACTDCHLQDRANAYHKARKEAGRRPTALPGETP